MFYVAYRTLLVMFCVLKFYFVDFNGMFKLYLLQHVTLIMSSLFCHANFDFIPLLIMGKNPFSDFLREDKSRCS